MGESLIQQHHVGEDRFIFVKPFYSMRIMTVIEEKVPTNLVPAVAVIRGGLALFEMIGRKGHVDGFLSCFLKTRAQLFIKNTILKG